MMLKAAIRSGIADACDWAGILCRAERKSRGSLVILCYHRILTEEQKKAYPMPDLAVTPASFDAHCATLAAYYEVHVLSEAIDLFGHGYIGDRPLAAVTFDDGYRDNIRHAAPILRAHRLQATFFIISGLAGISEGPWHDRLSRAANYLFGTNRLSDCLMEFDSPLRIKLERAATPNALVQIVKGFSPEERSFIIGRLTAQVPSDKTDYEIDRIMSWEDVKSLQRAGHEIASHSVSHEILPSLDDDSLLREVEGSKKDIERVLGSSIRGFCFPNGDYNEKILRAVKTANYSYSCTTRIGNNNTEVSPFELRRRFICENRLLAPSGVPSPALLRLELTGLADHFFMRARSQRSRR
jgi:peptidoglycan/xylan/chitin deacetylase (PgdA/CDA1 family)